MTQAALRPTAALAIALAIVAAGCLGATPAADEEADPAAAPLPDVHDDAAPETPGAIRGIVTDAARVPLEGATLTLLGENRSTTTGADGRYGFEGLANGRYLVVAEREGYETATQSAMAENGTVFELDFALPALPRTEPYSEVIELAGFLACHGVAQAAGNATRYDCGYLDPNQRHRFEVALRGDVQGLVIEAAWDANTPLSERLHVAAETVGYGADDAPLGDAAGKGYARVQVGQAALEKYYPQGGDVRVTVLPDPTSADEEADAGVGLALQQSFTVYVTAFYHQTAPPTYTVLEDA